VLALIGLLSAIPHTAMAGGGPENVLLVVNANSDSSKTIANHYIQLRHIPASNVVYIDWEGSVETCLGTKFLEDLLKPVFAAVSERRLNAQIDYIVYSSDFPSRIRLKSLFPEQEFPDPFRPVASLTGATYLSSYILTKNPAVVMPTTNWYVPGPRDQNQFRCQELGAIPSRGFRSRFLWNEEGRRTGDVKTGQRYLLSAMLGVTSGRGNTVEEVLRYLRRSAGADGTSPHGTIYFMKNKDVRSLTRHDCFDEMARQITALGVPAVVARGKIPADAHDIMGLMAGTAEFDLTAAHDTILPGAICEHLTSAGGEMDRNAGQTPLTEFLKHGAAGASGTVIEPNAIQAKFPLASLHLHYVRGCSMAESFYQSIAGPYQLLIVGDPLCQPWAEFPTVSADGIKPQQEVKGVVSITPSAKSKPPRRVVVFELFVDGRMVGRCLPGRAVSLNTAHLPDGYHELRIVSVDGGSIETRGRLIVPFFAKNHNAEIQWSVTPQANVGSADVVRVSARQPGATAIVIRQNQRELARMDGEGGDVEIPAELMGRGPVALQASSEGQSPAVTAPVWIEVQ
jgi:hypothetical protein